MPMFSAFIVAQGLSLCMVANGHDAPYVVSVQVSNLEHGRESEFQIRVRPDWAPKAARHFGDLLDAGFFEGERFWKVSSAFAAQFGTRRNLSAELCDNDAPADVRKVPNMRGKISFLPDVGSYSEVVISLKDNSIMDSKGAIPFAEVSAGLSILDRLYSGYGSGPRAPSYEKLKQEGNAYLQASFPKLSYIKVAERIQPEAEPVTTAFQSFYPVPSTALVAMGVAMCLVLPGGWIISLMRESSVPAQVF